MNYHEIKPGIYMSDNKRIHYKLDKCPCCGSTEAISHHKYTDKCVSCGNLYNLYTVRRSARRRNTLPAKALVAHMDTINRLLALRGAGGVIPASIDDEAAETIKALDCAPALPKAEYVNGECRYCGTETLLNKSSRCVDCEKKYQQYKALYATVDTLDLDECETLAQLIQHFIKQHNKGYSTPQYTRAIDRLNTRTASLGGERYKFYKMR